MLAILLLLAALSPSRVAAADVPSLVSDVATAAAAEGASMEDARLVATFAACESAGRADAIGDSGAACGVTQLHREWMGGHACAEVSRDRVLGLRLWLRALASVRERCGTTRAGLGVLAAGRCGGAPKLVSRRMKGRC
ncbi:MAG: hypothetical protein NVS3B10_05800 [Polyangiales bacterium]